MRRTSRSATAIWDSPRRMARHRRLIGTSSASPVDPVRKDGAVGRVLGALAGISAWVGWLTVCPALGFPTLGTAAMFNRVLVPREGPGSLFGWGLLLIGLAAAALGYLVLAGAGRFRPRVASGTLYGVIWWVIAGAIVMPLLGLALPAAQAAAAVAATPPDPMVGSFMMLHLGPAAPIAAFGYDRRGVETLDFGDGMSIRVGPGEGGFMGTQIRHAHVNADRVPAAAVAVLIVAAALALCLTLLGPWRRAARLTPAALALLIAVSVIGILNPWSNDWLFIAVRPASARGAVMPLPTASRVYESPDLGALPPGPCVEMLREITVVPGAEPLDVGSAGAVVLLALDGRVRVESADGASQLGVGGATLVPTGASVRVTNTGDGPAHVLSFSVAPTP